MSHNVPENLKYTKEHEWVAQADGSVSIGITDFAQSSLGDIVFVELPEPGTTIEAGSAFGVVESIKSVSDLYAPVTGEVVEKNGDLEESPELLNGAPYEQWMIKVKMQNPSELEGLLSATDYNEHCASCG